MNSYLKLRNHVHNILHTQNFDVTWYKDHHGRLHQGLWGLQGHSILQQGLKD